MIGSAARLAFAALSLSLCATVACGGDGGDSGGIVITNARARFTTTDVGAVYLDIRATGGGDTLIAASADIADDTQLHEIATDGGNAMMRAVEGGIPVEPGGGVSLRPGGYHVMLLGVGEIPEVGETFALTLEFERAGRMTVTVEVAAFGEDADAGGHSHE